MQNISIQISIAFKILLMRYAVVCAFFFSLSLLQTLAWYVGHGSWLSLFRSSPSLTKFPTPKFLPLSLGQGGACVRTFRKESLVVVFAGRGKGDEGHCTGSQLERSPRTACAWPRGAA